MKYINEYRNPVIIEKLVEKIHAEATGHYRFMEVCGSHTHAIRKYGIQSLLPRNIELLSGPGCPVCVTPQSFIDHLVQLSCESGVIITSYGDLLRVPGTNASLSGCREEGRDIRIIYSSMEALQMAISESGKQVVFAAIGFETTAPSTAVVIREARKKHLKNFKVLSAHKVMPPAMKAIIREGVKLNGYICPGHVSAVTGSKIYDIFPERFKVATVISGFEPVDILLSILMLIRQVNTGNYRTEIQYKRAVKSSGNPVALKLMRDVFEEADTIWRGLGELPDSGLCIKEKYEKIDAMRFFSMKPLAVSENPACICGEILKGTKKPVDCSLFGKACTPGKPVGACMVSPEGSCNAWIRWRELEETSQE